jgi:energy-converting hydrogenase Eha subunit A
VGSRNFFLHPVIAIAIGINVIVLALALAWAGDDTIRLWSLLQEDSPIEWMQFLCFTVLAGMLGFIAADRWKRQSRLNLDVIVIAGLSALVALAALEEISWFQRVLGFGSPDFFMQHNRQKEANLHNMVVGGVNLHKAILVKLIFIIGITHNLILPLIARSKPAVKRWVESMGLYLPPLSAGLAYLVLVLLSQVLVDHPRKGELSEMFGAVHYVSTVFAAYLIGVNYGKPAVIEHQADSRRVSTLFAMLLVFLFLVSWLLGVGYAPENPYWLPRSE